MVFLDGDHSYKGVKSDLNVLSRMLVENTPVLCHDYAGPEVIDPKVFDNLPDNYEVTPDVMWIGVQKACREWEQDGYAVFLGTFGCSGLYLTTSKCTGSKQGLRSSKFTNIQTVLDEQYTKMFTSIGY
jgi:hypothetical protein